jgi:hypothetical protein
MLVLKFYLVECIGVEFKFELDSNRFELVGKKKREGNRKVGQSFLLFSVISSFLSHFFFSQLRFLGVVSQLRSLWRPTFHVFLLRFRIP